MEEFFSARCSRATRHSRARGNPGLPPPPISSMSLDTRFRGYDGNLRFTSVFRVLHLYSSSTHGIFEGVIHKLALADEE